MKALAVLLASLLPIPTIAHIGDRVFQIPYVSADDLADIRMDGDLTDWKDLLGEPALTPLDFQLFYHQALTSYDKYDPSNLDFRIWMAWGDGGKIYVAIEAADDVYRNHEVEGGIHYFSDHVVMKIDGDHSGGQYLFNQYEGDDELPDQRNNAQAQYYEAKSYSEQKQSLVGLPFVTGISWMVEEPYALATGTVLGENPTFWTVEFYITAFDDMRFFSPEESRISAFQPGQIIGFDIGVFDWDRNENRMAQFYLHDSEHELALEGADGFVDAILMGPEGTAVEVTTWARIKETQ